MKKFLKIENKGLLDIRLVGLMGGSTKTNSKFKIGQFGTGLKYVLAFLVRKEIDYHIIIDGDKVNIEVKEEEIAGELFNILLVDGERTSITDRMGLEWEHWMIVRELYSNALDEGDEVYGIVEESEVFVDYEKKLGKTQFYIELTPEFLQVYNNWSKYFIVGHVPMFENQRFAVHPSGEKMKIYKHGILIHESEQKSVFSYDIKNARINEMRQYMGSLSLDVYNCICDFDEKAATYFLENCRKEKDHYEATMDYGWDYFGDGQFGKSWSKAIGNAKLIHQEALDEINNRGLDIDTGGMITVPKNVYKALTTKFEGVGALRVADKIGDFFEVHNYELLDRVLEAKSILFDAGYFIDEELNFVFGVFGDKNTLAKINIDKKEILISENHIDRSLFDICTMLIEENEHYKTNLPDCSRGFQQHFINLYTKEIFGKSGVKL